MSINMHYCRYENVTRGFEELHELLDLDEEAIAELNEEELRYFKRLVQTIVGVVEDIRYTYDDGDDNYTVEDGVKALLEKIERNKNA